MDIKDFVDIYKEVMENHGWNKLYDNTSENRKIYKYVDFKLDTRDGQIWLVRFRQGTGEKTFRGKNMKEDILAWLKKSRDKEEISSLSDYDLKIKINELMDRYDEIAGQLWSTAKGNVEMQILGELNKIKKDIRKEDINNFTEDEIKFLKYFLILKGD